MDAAFGMHVMPHVTTGHLAGNPGTIMAAAHLWEATIVGRGGHAAKPHMNTDAVLAGSAVVMALQVRAPTAILYRPWKDTHGHGQDTGWLHHRSCRRPGSIVLC